MVFITCMGEGNGLAEEITVTFVFIVSVMIIIGALFVILPSMYNICYDSAETRASKPKDT